MTPSIILKEAADLIEPDGAWTQGYFARDAWGNRVDLNSTKAKCYCVLGALTKICQKHPSYNPNVQVTPEVQDLFNKALGLLNTYIGLDAVIWNDRKERTQGEVVDSLRKASEMSA